MLYTARSDYIIKHKPIFQMGTSGMTRRYPEEQIAAKKARIYQELKDLGVGRYYMLWSETKQLPRILHDDEHLNGIVYGKCEDGYAVLAATDRRVLFIDKKPLFVKADEMTYDIVGGVSFGSMGPVSTITLHTRMGDYKMRTMNLKSAQYFVHYIEGRCLERLMSGKENKYDYTE